MAETLPATNPAREVAREATDAQWRVIDAPDLALGPGSINGQEGPDTTNSPVASGQNTERASVRVADKISRGAEWVADGADRIANLSSRASEWLANKRTVRQTASEYASTKKEDGKAALQAASSIGVGAIRKHKSFVTNKSAELKDSTVEGFKSFVANKKQDSMERSERRRERWQARRETARAVKTATKENLRNKSRQAGEIGQIALITVMDAAVRAPGVAAEVSRAAAAKGRESKDKLSNNLAERKAKFDEKSSDRAEYLAQLHTLRGQAILDKANRRAGKHFKKS
jgi:hypothetical protein